MTQTASSSRPFPASAQAVPEGELQVVGLRLVRSLVLDERAREVAGAGEVVARARMRVGAPQAEQPPQLADRVVRGPPRAGRRADPRVGAAGRACRRPRPWRRTAGRGCRRPRPRPPRARRGAARRAAGRSSASRRRSSPWARCPAPSCSPARSPARPAHGRRARCSACPCARRPCRRRPPAPPGAPPRPRRSRIICWSAAGALLPSRISSSPRGPKAARRSTALPRRRRRPRPSSRSSRR